ncbi:ABC transporter substrate-binding protein [Magnetospira sp. QH-2]|uniref:ABC transporter substrate-binding protein n=1 Tax=Magnetospira sp. (strain QH-2) TaxID=1288970 RepID=UPI0006977F90|nr:ABC transporter substrate-binding protein [Magnetospira sp. QH-2]
MFRILSVIVALMLLAPTTQAENATPDQTIGHFHEQLLEAMENAFAEDVTERYDRLVPAVGAAYDFPFMVRIAVGSHWSQTSAAQKQALTEAFGRMSTATYAHHFNGYSGEKFETVETRDGPKGTRIVDTRIVSPDGGRTDIAYVMHHTNSGWRIANVILEKGVSQLAVHRSEYAAVLKQGGADALVKVLTDKADTLLIPQ